MAHSASSTGVDFVKDTYIPVFSNRPADYKEWRKRILLYKKKSDINKKGREATINLLTSLSGVAWRQIENLVDKATESEDGFQLILDELDKTFKYDDQVEMPRAFENFFYKTSRRDGQSLLSYVADHREALGEVERHGITIPDKISGWLLLRRAGLSMEQKQLEQGRGPELTQTSVTESLYYLLGQDYRGKATTPNRSWKGTGRGAGQNSSRNWNRGNVYVTEEVYDAEEEEIYETWAEEPPWPEEEQDYDEPTEDNVYYEDEMEELHDLDEEFFTEVEQRYEDAYATYLDARRQMANLKASRGYYPVVALTEPNALAGASPPQMPRPPSPPKGKSGGKSKSKGKSKGSAWQTKGPTIAARGQATKCLRCGQPGHWAAQCPQNSGKSSPSRPALSPAAKKPKTEGAAMMVRDLVQSPKPGLPFLSSSGWFGIQDGGASSVVCGHDTLMQVIGDLMKRGVPQSNFHFTPANKTFGFGGDASRAANWAVRLPCWIGGKSGFMETFIVPGSTPLLVGRPILQALRVQMNFETGQMSINDQQWFEVPLGERGEYLLQLDDGLSNDPKSENVFFDYVTEETYQSAETETDYPLDLRNYLLAIGREQDEYAFVEDNLIHEDTESADLEAEDEEDATAFRKPITDKLIKSLHMNFGRFQSHRQSALETALHAHQQGKRVFWEVYSGSGNLSDVMQTEGWEVQTFDINNGWDFENSAHRREFLQMLDLVCPEFVWFAPPCTVWSSLQNINVDTEEKKQALQADRDFQENTHLRMCRRGYLKQLREGRHAAIEQPKTAASWRTTTWRSLTGYDAIFDQCQYGCTLPDENGEEQYIRKPTTVRCTDEDMAKHLTRHCSDDHYHLPIEGSSPGLGNRAEAAGIYQVGLCYAFCQAIDHTVTTDYAEYAYAGDEEPSSMEVEEPAGDDAGDPEDVVRPPRGILKRLTDTDNQQAKRTVQRLHRNLGHPTNGELVRLLQTKNAAEPLLQAARDLECNLCDLHRRPASVPVSSLPRQGTFNTRVQADTLWIQVPGARRQLPILMISDSTIHG